jgi:Glycosyl transferase family 2
LIELRIGVGRGFNCGGVPGNAKEVIQGSHSVKTRQDAKVAVLLATYNGARFIEPQLRSLQENATAFTLHWLDDHSADHSRETVRLAARNLGIDLQEWHQPARQRLPGAFFQLLECVEADIYCFCDQDDIWQPGKIDATVANLLPDLAAPVLCFSDSLMFYDDEPAAVRRISDVFGSKPPRALQESRLFMTLIAPGHTQGFTRSLRDLYLRHKDVARAYARSHDGWMYLIASASGSARMLSDVPTALYRQHGGNVITALLSRRGKRFGSNALTWSQQQSLRRLVARHAQGFILASPTLPPGQKLERLLALAKLVATLDQRQSPAALWDLFRRGALWPNRRWAAWFAAACLWSDASS